MGRGWVVVRRLRAVCLFLAMGVLAIPSPFPPVLASVPPVLDGIVAASIESARDLSPLLPHFRDHSLDGLSLFGRDRVVVQVRLEILMIAFPALLW
jgi:hypothetical protein